MSEYKYKSLQGMLERNIKAGVFSHKLPSIRAMVKSQNVSMSTVQKAYEGLELLGRDRNKVILYVSTGNWIMARTISVLWLMS